MGRRIGPLLFFLGAVALWISSRMPWVKALAEDDKSGSASHDIIGSTWSLELMAVTLLLLAGAVAGVALRRTARRVVGAVCAIAAAGVAWRPVDLLVSGADPLRAQKLLQGAASNENAVETESIAQWASVRSADVAWLGPTLALLGAAAALFGGIVLAMRPGKDRPKATSKYETPAAREANLAQDLDNNPDSGRVMWEALDADIDPTDLGGARSRPQSKRP